MCCGCKSLIDNHVPVIVGLQSRDCGRRERGHLAHVSPASSLETAAETFRCLSDLCGLANDAALEAIYDLRANCLVILRDLEGSRTGRVGGSRSGLAKGETSAVT